ncbi:unnamed protein product, partial [Closterium sp. NIES-54]
MAAQELHWLTYVLADLGEQPRSSPVLYIDNKAMISLCQKHRLEHITKHIALRFFLARELQQRGQLRLAYAATRANTVDVFTKALQSGYDHCTVCSLLYNSACELTIVAETTATTSTSAAAETEAAAAAETAAAAATSTEAKATTTAPAPIASSSSAPTPITDSHSTTDSCPTRSSQKHQHHRKFLIQLRSVLTFTWTSCRRITMASKSEGLGFEFRCMHFGHPSAGGCQRSTGDPRLIIGKGYRHVGLGGYGRTDPLLNKPFYPN